MNLDKSSGLKNEFNEPEGGKESFWKQGILKILIFI